MTILINPPKDEYNALDFSFLLILVNVSAYKCEMQGLNVIAYIFAEKCDTDDVLEHLLEFRIIFSIDPLFCLIGKNAIIFGSYFN